MKLLDNQCQPPPSTSNNWHRHSTDRHHIATNAHIGLILIGCSCPPLSHQSMHVMIRIDYCCVKVSQVLLFEFDYWIKPQLFHLADGGLYECERGVSSRARVNDVEIGWKGGESKGICTLRHAGETGVIDTHSNVRRIMFCIGVLRWSKLSCVCSFNALYCVILYFFCVFYIHEWGWLIGQAQWHMFVFIRNWQTRYKSLNEHTQEHCTEQRTNII